MNTITLPRPVNRHFHPRQGSMLKILTALVSSVYRAAVMMGNTTPPRVTLQDLQEWGGEMVKYFIDPDFEALLTVMLVNRTTPKIIREVAKYQEKNARFWGLKLIPGGTSTNIAAGADPNAGVSLWDLEQYYPVLKVCQDLSIPFSVHWELVNEKDGTPIPEKEREEWAMRFLLKVAYDFPNLKIIVEHVTTMQMVGLVDRLPANVTATITGHHPFTQYDQVADEDGVIINPGLYCKPIAKPMIDMLTTREAMFSGGEKFSFGDDSAWHLAERKFAPTPAAGIFNPFSLQIMVHEFEQASKLEKLAPFVSLLNLQVYGLKMTDDEGIL